MNPGRIRITLVGRDGNKVADMPEGFTSGDLEIMRSDLVAILYSATQGDVEYIFNDSVAGLQETLLAKPKRSKCRAGFPFS